MVEWKFVKGPTSFCNGIFEEYTTEHGGTQISICKLESAKYNLQLWHENRLKLQEFIVAADWDEAKAYALSIVTDYLAKQAAYWRDLKIVFNNWVNNQLGGLTMKIKYIAEDGTQFDTEKECLTYENAPVIYIIKNTVNEYNDRITRFCNTLEEAKIELKDCSDWCNSKGTGRIYQVRLNTNMEPKYTLIFQR